MSSKPPISSQQRGRRRRLLWGGLVFVLLVAAGAYLALSRPWEPKPIAVTVEILSLGPVSRVLAVNGSVAAKTSVAVRSSVAGQVLAVLAAEGDSVAKDQLAIELDSSQPRALVAQAQAAFEAGNVKLQQAQTDVDRARALGDNTPRKTLEDANLALTAAHNELDRLQAGLDQAQSQLAEYEIRSPLDGVVLARNVEPGQIVDTQSTLLTIADTARLVVKMDVDELYAAQIRTGLKVILAPVGVATPLNGTISFASPVVDATTGGRAVEASFDEQASLPVGLTVMANILVDTEAAALTIPRSALIVANRTATAFVIGPKGAEERQVSYVDWPADRVIVTSGLAAGDQVILNPTGIRDGAAVKVKAN